MAVVLAHVAELEKVVDGEKVFLKKKWKAFHAALALDGLPNGLALGFLRSIRQLPQYADFTLDRG